MTIDEYNRALEPFFGETLVTLWLNARPEPRPVVVSLPRIIPPNSPVAHQTITFTQGTGPYYCRIRDIVHITRVGEKPS